MMILTKSHTRTILLVTGLLLLNTALAFASSRPDEFSATNQTLTWHSPGLISLNSVPLGNGDCGVNVWVERNGDVLLLLAKSDAWSDNGRLEKPGRIRLSFSPSPFSDTATFLQTLDVRNGLLTIRTGPDNNPTSLELRVDAHHPALIATLTSPAPVTTRATLELWRTEPRALNTGEEVYSAYGVGSETGPPVIVEPDSVLHPRNNRLLWLHRNHRSIWKANLRLQALEPLITTLPDPLLYRTFGGMIEGNGMKAVAPAQLVSTAPSRTARVIVTLHTTPFDSTGRWLAEIEDAATRLRSANERALRQAHTSWWNAFQKRSHIIVTSSDPTERSVAEAVTRGYMLQRYVLACAARGTFPIKFNGSLFTVDTYDRPGPAGGLDPDFRRWGGPFWFQNTRLAYWPMLASGDLEMMDPLFRMYLNALPLRRTATRTYYHHDGAYFPETMNFWGTYTDENYGRDRSGMPPGLTQNLYIRYHWNGAVELLQLMLDRYAFHPEASFVRATLIPLATDVLRFFALHWPRSAAGTIRFEPSQALETYQSGVVDPMPDVAGLRTVGAGMLALPESLTTPALRSEWRDLLRALPPVPMRFAGTDTLLAPAAAYETSSNIENPELYPIFPFRLYGLGKPGLSMARRTYAARANRVNGGWQQHAVQAAYLGLTDSAASLVADNFMQHDTLCRFPAFWGPNFDWTPDQDHGSVAMIALQRMLLQYEGDSLLFLPAWPAKWDVQFRLHAPGGTVVEGTVVHGTLRSLDVSPMARKKDLRIAAPQ
jgi:alpha-L-fucosidase 2